MRSQRVCAAALFEGEDFHLSWCNDEYRAFLQDAYGVDPHIGRSLRDFAPLSAAAKERVLHRVLHTGSPETGVDRVFSVEDGTTVIQWALYRPFPNTVLALFAGGMSSGPSTQAGG